MGVSEPGSVSLKAEEIVDRVVLSMLNEAVYCLQEGIIRSARDGDIGAIFGLGFPPFTGGPFRYLESRGLAQVVSRLRALESQFGSRFTPAPMLVELAESVGSFFQTR